MDFNFSVDELVVIVSALRTEYRRYLEGWSLAGRKAYVATATNAREFVRIRDDYRRLCILCAQLYKKIIDKDILEDL